MSREKSNRKNPAENLSASRGNPFGVTLLIVLARLLGINRACEFLWVVTLFYALFDRTARNRARPYIRHRFPGRGPLREFFHLWRFFTSQGQSLLESTCIPLGRVRIRQEHFDRMETFLNGDAGFIILSSHFGAWQASIRAIDPTRKKRANILMQPDANTSVDKFMSVQGQCDAFGVISTESPMGGLIDVSNALDRGEVVCIMGDRARENEPFRVPFFGEDASFPAAAFHIAATTGVPIIPIFAFRSDRHKTVTVLYGEPLRPKHARKDKALLRKSIAQYAALLEEMARKHPYELYLFEDIWRPHDAKG